MFGVVTLPQNTKIRITHSFENDFTIQWLIELHKSYKYLEQNISKINN